MSESLYWTHRNHQRRRQDFGGRITKAQSLEMSIEGFRLNVRGASQLRYESLRVQNHPTDWEIPATLKAHACIPAQADLPSTFNNLQDLCCLGNVRRASALKTKRTIGTLLRTRDNQLSIAGYLFGATPMNSPRLCLRLCGLVRRKADRTDLVEEFLNG